MLAATRLTPVIVQPESVRRRRISDMNVSEMVQHSAKLKRVGNELIKVGGGAHCPAGRS